MLRKIYNSLKRHISHLDYSMEELVRSHGGVVGKDVYIGDNVLIDLDWAFLLEIGDGAVISARTVIELHDSSLPNVMGRGKLRVGRVRIGRRAYIGVNTVVLPGVQIGDGAIVGASSLVNTNIPSREVWAGSPARFITTVDALVQKRESIGNTRESAGFDWMGQPEKKTSDYENVKKAFISDVKEYFATQERLGKASSNPR